MEEMNRRSAIGLAMALGASAVVAADPPKPGDEEKPKKRMTDREMVIACGMTPEEADCWEYAAKAAGKFFDLPKLHPMDDQEVASAIHILQNKLLSRPTYRRYLEMAKSQPK